MAGTSVLAEMSTDCCGPCRSLYMEYMVKMVDSDELRLSWMCSSSSKELCEFAWVCDESEESGEPSFAWTTPFAVGIFTWGKVKDGLIAVPVVSIDAICGCPPYGHSVGYVARESVMGRATQLANDVKGDRELLAVVRWHRRRQRRRRGGTIGDCGEVEVIGHTNLSRSLQISNREKLYLLRSQFVPYVSSRGIVLCQAICTSLRLQLKLALTASLEEGNLVSQLSVKLKTAAS